MVLQTVRNLDREKAEAKAREEARISSEAQAKEIETKLNELTETKRKLAEVEGKAKEGEEAVKALRCVTSLQSWSRGKSLRVSIIIILLQPLCC